MCGLFGFAASTQNDSLNLAVLEQIAIDTESRGPHSFGLAWIDSRNRLRMFKQTGRISRNLDVLQMVVDAKLLIGHCRFATHGEINAINAHPHPSDGGWIMHNGQIFDYQSINEEYALSPVSDCDSETIGLLIEELDGTMVERVAKACRVCAGGPFAMMGIWKSPNRMMLARSGNPLHIGSANEGHYFASRPNALSDARSLSDGELLALTFRDRVLDLTRHRFRRSRSLV